jgi:polyisoprenoid-binding protein YceI
MRIRSPLLSVLPLAAILALGPTALPAQAVGAPMSIPPAPNATTDYQAAPSGAYTMDPAHTSITFKILHMGFSHYTGRFDRMDGTLNFDSQNPANSALDVTIDTNSVDTNNAKLEEELRGENFFNVIKFPTATFKSDKITVTGPTTGTITGTLTMLGQTHEITLDATLVGAGTHMMTKKQVLGFSAVGTFKRSDFGFNNLIPIVGDDVTLQLESEFDKAE